VWQIISQSPKRAHKEKKKRRLDSFYKVLKEKGPKESGEGLIPLT